MKSFQKHVENFKCRKCGKITQGDGYTNHCPFCLWSRHVDLNPGDRQNECRGMMRPIAIEQKGGRCRLVHKCTKCGAEKINKISPQDNFSKIIKLSKNHA